jgi:hypothetical protein
MESIWVFIMVPLVALIIFVPPVFLFRPLVLAIADRIAGKRADSGEVKMLKQKIEGLEAQVAVLQHRIVVVEDSSEFSKRLLEDISKKPAEK